MNYILSLSQGHLVLVILSALLVGISKAGIKGTGLVMVPIMALVFGAKPSTGIVLPMLIMADVMAVVYYRKSVKWKYIRKLIPWAVLGILAGFFTGDLIDEGSFKWLLGAIIIAVLLLLIINDVRKSRSIPDNRIFAGLMGVAGGFVTMVGNAAGPVFSIYLLAMRLPKKEFIGTGAWFFFIINLAKVPLHVFFWKTITPDTIAADLILLPAIILGMVAGVRLVRLFPDKVYRYFVIVMTFIGAVIMIAS